MEESKKIIVFSLDNEQYGVPIEQVKEVVRMEKTYKLPNMPKYIEGVINLRGNVYVIYNLRSRFNMQEKEFDESTRIILINEKNIGFIVDEVKEVVQAEKKDMDQVGELSTIMDRTFIEGVVKSEKGIVVILNLDNILSKHEKDKIDNISLANLK